MIDVILLSGGSGSRLWPLSNEARSKQFLKVLRDNEGYSQSMVQRTFSMLENVPVEKRITIATCASQTVSIDSQVSGGYDLVVEPERRDTAPAIMLSAMHLAFSENANLDDTVVVMPIDTYAAQGYYDNIIRLDEAVQQGVSDLVLMGASPTYPSEKFGYIVTEGTTSPRRVTKFVEKPDVKEAETLISKGALWNCGVFAFKLRYLVDIVSGYGNFESFEEVLDQYSTLPKISFDYEVVEKADSIAVIAYNGIWKDLGTWNTLTEEMADFQSGRVVTSDCRNTHLINETGLPMVVSGLQNAVVVATPDGILVSDKQASAHLKPLVSEAAETRPMYEARKWGEYKVLSQDSFLSGTCSLEKILIIKPGAQLSYQRHKLRSEVWTIVDGEGEVVIGEDVIPVSPGSVVSIPKGEKHSVRANTELHIVEVQIGTELVEEDIERFGFFWPEEAE